MARPVGSLNKSNSDFIQHFDKLSKKHIDPLVLMFKIAADDPDVQQVDSEGKLRPVRLEFRSEAAKQLLKYRYPQLKAVEVKEALKDKQLTIAWDYDNAGSDTVPATPVPTTTTH